MIIQRKNIHKCPKKPIPIDIYLAKFLRVDNW